MEVSLYWTSLLTAYCTLDNILRTVHPDMQAKAIRRSITSAIVINTNTPDIPCQSGYVYGYGIWMVEKQFMPANNIDCIF